MQHYKIKVKYFLMNLIRNQETQSEFVISQSFINKFVNQLSNKLIQNLIQDDLSINNMVKLLLDHTSFEENE